MGGDRNDATERPRRRRREQSHGDRRLELALFSTSVCASSRKASTPRFPLSPQLTRLSNIDAHTPASKINTTASQRVLQSLLGPELDISKALGLAIGILDKTDRGRVEIRKEVTQLVLLGLESQVSNERSEWGDGRQRQLLAHGRSTAKAGRAIRHAVEVAWLASAGSSVLARRGYKSVSSHSLAHELRGEPPSRRPMIRRLELVARSVARDVLVSAKKSARASFWPLFFFGAGVSWEPEA